MTPAAQTSEPLAADDFRELARLNHSGTHTCAGACLAEVVAAFEAEAAAPASPGVVREVRHALDALNKASDKMLYGDSPETDLLEAHATLDSLLAALRAAAPAPLDVERLEAAYDRHFDAPDHYDECGSACFQTFMASGAYAEGEP